MAFSIFEYLVELYMFPASKQYQSLSLFGLFLLIAAQSLRLSGVITAASNFQHQIAEFKKKDHKLVTTGIYKVFRHPAYTGYFYWGIGTQILLLNPISTLGFALALHSFFKHRIPYEEELLIEFFGQEYIDYKSRTKIWIPFL